MVSQAVNEGIIKFIAEKNDIKKDKAHEELLDEFVQKNFMTSECAKASKKFGGVLETMFII